MVPSYIQDFIPPLVSEFSDYPLRNNRNIPVPLNITCIPQKSCIPSSFEDDLKTYQHYIPLKNILHQSSINHARVPPYFTIGNRYISVLHAWLRNRCSNLNNGLFSNYIRGNPLCDLCGVVEYAIHYFFHCRKFKIERQGLNDTVRVFSRWALIWFFLAMITAIL